MYRPTFHPKNDLILGLFFGKIASELVYTRYQYEQGGIRTLLIVRTAVLYTPEYLLETGVCRQYPES